MREETVLWCQSTTEVFPFSKLGGLGDYVYTFSKELRDRGHQVLIFSPFYEKNMLPLAHKQTYKVEQKSIFFRKEQIHYESLTCEYEGMTYVFFRYPPFWGHDEIFRGQFAKYNENMDGSTLLAKAMVQELRTRVQKSATQQKLIIQGNDAFSSFFAPLLHAEDFPDAEITKLYCIHNFSGDSIGPIYRMDEYFLDPELKTNIAPVFKRDKSWLEVFFPFFDQFMTVSENYLKEIIEGDHPLNLMLRDKYREGKMQGFLNGIDNEFWSIQTSPYIQKGEDESITDVKRRYKKEFCEKTGFSIHEPMLIFVGRMTYQKGIHRLNAILELEPELGIVVLGQGEPLENFIEEKHRARLYHISMYSEEVCHQLFAAADYSIVPSEYEPCGYVAMYAPRFGVIPFVRRTGGLQGIGERIEQVVPSGIQFDSAEEFVERYRSLLSLRLPQDEEGLTRLIQTEWKWEEVIEQIERFVFRPFQMSV